VERIENKIISRRQLMSKGMIAGTALSLFPSRPLFGLGADRHWVKYAGNPVLGGQYGTCFDVCVLREFDVYRMWVSWRPKQSVAITESKDGINWKPPEIVLAPSPETGWEDDINRPVVVHRADGYHMWYTGQANGRSSVGYATSSDGRQWVRQSGEPALKPELPWEGVAIMCPHAMWDAGEKLWKMWYSAGTQYEPNAIGYATSADGLHWEKYPGNPVLAPDARNEWEQNRVAAAQIIRVKEWYYAFYIGFRDIDHAQIGMARSKDGITGWVRHAGNPIVRPTPGGWDSDACYKPYAVHADGSWRLWYNGRQNHLEQIGLVLHRGESLDFTARS
jgi:beta-1,2-mannobiose phosphorylase / 1,2-beta-oligomannan phosphorylase